MGGLFPGIFAFLYSSEYTSASTKPFDKNSTLQAADIKIMQVKTDVTNQSFKNCPISGRGKHVYRTV